MCLLFYMLLIESSDYIWAIVNWIKNIVYICVVLILSKRNDFFSSQWKSRVFSHENLFFSYLWLIWNSPRFINLSGFWCQSQTSFLVRICHFTPNWLIMCTENVSYNPKSFFDRGAKNLPKIRELVAHKRKVR